MLRDVKRGFYDGRDHSHRDDDDDREECEEDAEGECWDERLILVSEDPL